MNVVTLPDITLTSSSIPVNYYLGAVIPAWSIASYSDGDLVYQADSTPHYVYCCTSAITSEVTDKVPSLDQSRWRLIGTTDRWAMFDNMRQTYSRYLFEFSGEVSVSGCDYVGIYNLDAVEVELTFMVGSEIVKQEVISLVDSISNPDWYEYFFEIPKIKSQVTWRFPIYHSGARLLYRIANVAGGVAKCGVFRPGVSFDTGSTQKGLSSRVVDYSNKSSTSLSMVLPGGNADDVDLTLIIPVGLVESVYSVFKGNCGRPAIYDCNNEGEEYLDSLVVYGLFRTFERVFKYGRFVRCNVGLQGLT
jgi:hypothetical protein